jgi:ribosomal protein L11 methyltransferase
MYIWRKRVTSDWLRLRSDELNRRFGAALAIVEQPGQRQIALQVSCPTIGQARALVRELGGKAEKLPRDWLRDFAKRAEIKPLRLGSRVIIRSAPERKGAADSARTIVIPAEAAFGTGEHATTAMCLRLLERHTRRRPPGWTMLDAGTGSGILAIAARCLGAARVLAIDNDPLACAIARRNARANRIRHLEFRSADVLDPKSERFDIITANLFSEILVAALPGWTRSLRRGGFVILSGILRSQENAVVSALRRNGFALEETRRRGKWVALLAEQRTAQRALPT